MTLYLVEDFPREEPLLKWVAEKYGNPIRAHDVEPLVCPVCERAGCVTPDKEAHHGTTSEEECDGVNCHAHFCYPIGNRSGVH